MAVYAILDGTKRRKQRRVVNIIVCEPDVLEEIAPGAVEIDRCDPGAPGIDWTTKDGGRTWKPPESEPLPADELTELRERLARLEEAVGGS